MKRLSIICFLLILAADKGVAQEKIKRIIDDQFAYHPFPEPLSPSNIKKHVLEKALLEKRPNKNKHNSDIDTLLVFRTANCEFKFLKTKFQTMFYEATIMSNCVKLSKGIEFGLSFDHFVRIFNASKLQGANRIVVVDAAEFWYDSFYFKDGKLEKITLSGRID